MTTKKETTSFMKDPTKLLTAFVILGTIFLGWLTMFGKGEYMGAEEGKQLEKRTTAIEHKVDMQHHLQMIKHDHTVEKIEGLSEDFVELKKAIKMHFPHSNPTGP